MQKVGRAYGMARWFHRKPSKHVDATGETTSVQHQATRVMLRNEASRRSLVIPYGDEILHFVQADTVALTKYLLSTTEGLRSSFPASLQGSPEAMESALETGCRVPLRYQLDWQPQPLREPVHLRLPEPLTVSAMPLSDAHVRPRDDHLGDCHRPSVSSAGPPATPGYRMATAKRIRSGASAMAGGIVSSFCPRIVTVPPDRGSAGRQRHAR